MSPSLVLFGPKGVPRLDLSKLPGKSRVGGGEDGDNTRGAAHP